MLNRLKAVVTGKTSKENSKVLPKNIINSKSDLDAVLPSIPINVIEQTKPILKVSTPKVESSNFALVDDIATIFLEGERITAVKMLVEHLTLFKGNVDKKFWYLLMDAHQIMGNRPAFEQTALAFSKKFETSSPSWFNNSDDEKDLSPVMSSGNALILDPIFGTSQANTFKDFLKTSRKETFCRINVSQCKFEQADPIALKSLYNLFKNLRKYEVKAVLMGDNNLISFCKNYINPNLEKKGLRECFLEMEEDFWLIYLEILQWKGRQEDFENIAIEYAMKFEVSPPGWEDNGIMKIETIQEKDEIVNDFEEIKITGQNVNILLELITKKFTETEKCEIDFSKVEVIDFESAGSITFHIQELWSNPKYENKRVVLKYPNEMILTLFDMVGTTEFLEIIHRKR